MLLPGDFKRDYKFRSNKQKDRVTYIVAIVISIIAFLVIWFIF
jgi:hypothetical protein